MDENKKRIIPLLPLRGILVFPSMVLHLDVGRSKSVQALEKVMLDDHEILLSTQTEISIDEPTEEQLHKVGTLATIKQMLKLPNGTIRVLVEGLKRAKIERFLENDEMFEVEMQVLSDDTEEVTPAEIALMRSTLKYFEQYIKLSKKVSAETLAVVSDITEPGRLADVIASHLPLKIAEKQELLECTSAEDRLLKIIDILNNEKEVLGLEKKISQRVKKSIEKTQKEYYLREQMKAIQKELGDRDGKTDEVSTLQERIKEAGMPEHVEEKALKELERYEKMPPS
ncbi:MAG TPA: endopeptidase La, partial [Bacilli bacterium]|nr:endopeptidase La [Bacilli bacterium]